MCVCVLNKWMVWDKTYKERKFQRTKLQQTTMYTAKAQRIANQAISCSVALPGQQTAEPANKIHGFYYLLYAYIIKKNKDVSPGFKCVVSAGRCVVPSCLRQPQSMQWNRLPLYYPHVYTRFLRVPSLTQFTPVCLIFSQITGKQLTTLLEIPLKGIGKSFTLDIT